MEIVLCAKADLPLELTGNVAIWVESAQPGASAYHFVHPSSDKSSPAIEYINNQWYLLSWDEGKYYTNLSL